MGRAMAIQLNSEYLPQQPTRTPTDGITRFDVAVCTTAVLFLLATLALAFLQRTYPQQVAYLHPVRGGIQNIWVAPLDNPDEARQVTFSDYGIYNFDVSPDGRYIAYADRDETGLTDLWLHDLHSNNTTRLTNCLAQDADCKTPVFNADGSVIAYERMNINRNLAEVGPGAIRIWLVDPTRQPYNTSPLSENSLIIGHSPQWSQDNNSIAFYNADLANPSIFIYTFDPDEGERNVKSVSSLHGTVGALAPNGDALIYPEIVNRDSGLYTHLRIADLDTLESEDLTPAQGANDDPDVVWHPEGNRATIGRRYTDERYTPGYQIYSLDLESQQATPLMVDERYSHGFFSWDEAGEWLVIQRFPLTLADGSPAIDASPEIWVLNDETGAMTRIAEDAFLPRWVESSE
jgi:Tol biopolymer transport system component